MILVKPKSILRAVFCEDSDECLADVKAILTDRDVLLTDEGLHIVGSGVRPYGQFLIFDEDGDWEEVPNLDGYDVVEGTLVTAVKLGGWWAVQFEGNPPVTFKDAAFQKNYARVSGDTYLQQP